MLEFHNKEKYQEAMTLVEEFIKVGYMPADNLHFFPWLSPKLSELMNEAKVVPFLSDLIERSARFANSAYLYSLSEDMLSALPQKSGSSCHMLGCNCEICVAIRSGMEPESAIKKYEGEPPLPNHQVVSALKDILGMKSYYCRSCDKHIISSYNSLTCPLCGSYYDEPGSTRANVAQA